MKKKILITFLLCVVLVAPNLTTLNHPVFQLFSQHGGA